MGRLLVVACGGLLGTACAQLVGVDDWQGVTASSGSGATTSSGGGGASSSMTSTAVSTGTGGAVASSSISSGGGGVGGTDGTGGVGGGIMCGNGITDAGEECDDGNSDNLDGCMNNCRRCTISTVGFTDDDPVDPHCYALDLTSLASWQSSEQYCIGKFGGHLAAITSATEETLIATKAPGISAQLWIGAIYSGSAYAWTTGEAFVYADFGGAGGGKNCVSISPSTGWTWVDSNCALALGKICER